LLLNPEVSDPSANSGQAATQLFN